MTGNAEDRKELLDELLCLERYEQAVLYIERRITDGDRIATDVLERIPTSYRRRSPILMQCIGMQQWHAGKLTEARESMELAARGWAEMYVPRAFLPCLAMLGHIQLRLGDFESAEVISEQLQREEQQLEAEAAIAHFQAVGCTWLPSALRGGDKDRLNPHAVKLFRFSILAYAQQGRWEEACMATVDLALRCAPAMSVHAWNELYYECRVRGASDPQLAPLIRLLQLLKAYGNRQWSTAMTTVHELSTCNVPLPYTMVAAMAITSLHCSVQLGQEAQTHIDGIRACMGVYPSDLTLQYELLSCIACSHQSAEDSDHDLELQQLAGILREDQRSLPHPHSLYPKQESSHVPWQLHLFGGMRFLRGQEERLHMKWKRNKAKELLLFLALQPNYSGIREQIIEALQLGDEADKALQQLYVIIHQLKRTLHAELGMEQAVIVRNGLIKLREEAIEYVDVEQYLTLIRVADQLWSTDRSLSYEMYEQAYMLYDELLPELPYLEWLEQVREHLAHKQVSLLQKCLTHAEQRQDWMHAEIYLLSWLAIKPYQEEAHSKLIRLYIRLGRHLEAKDAYASWEECCKTELGAVPSFRPHYS
ncbi:AfsR/SARP family transcriptional regulator [Paenibacillus chungangensis]|uniref:BTAD domain-containing putative transcriptional regulator n=1 Tax=Paenibacillus chungangensis TaxID=696535 RepID=A0ABW3HP42_9BACL